MITDKVIDTNLLFLLTYLKHLKRSVKELKIFRLDKFLVSPQFLKLRISSDLDILYSD